ncbi:MAG: glutaredoxin family protein [Roseovarius sp.]|nr:glutaredoxin family protein [Roseovarius sp.]
MIRRALVPALGLALGLGLGAAPPLEAGPRQSRTPLGEAIREALIAHPELLAPLTGPAPMDIYADEVARDLDLLEREAPHLFAPGLPGFGPGEAAPRIAFFTAPDCPDCATAEAELSALAARLGLRVSVFDITAHDALAARLGLDMAPSYVLPDRLLRGAMPAIVLERYLAP